MNCEDIQYISENGFYYLWIIGALGTFSMSWAVFAWSSFIGNVWRRLLWTLGFIALFWGVLTLVGAIYGLIWGGSFTFLSAIRAYGNAFLPGIVGTILNLINWRAYALSEKEKTSVIDSVEIIALSKQAREEARRARMFTQNALYLSE